MMITFSCVFCGGKLSYPYYPNKYNDLIIAECIHDNFNYKIEVYYNSDVYSHAVEKIITDKYKITYASDYNKTNYYLINLTPGDGKFYYSERVEIVGRAIPNLPIDLANETIQNFLMLH